MDCTIIGNGNEEVAGLAFRSDEVAPGDMFFCIVGTVVDGHSFAQDAIDRGATSLVAERKVYLADATDVTEVVVSDSRKAMAYASANYYDNPSRAFSLVGITGTNGKTTTTYLVEHIASVAGNRCGVIGTVGNKIAGVMEHAERTTPESPDLQKLFARMRDAGCTVVAMEVSSHALDLRRTWDTDFAVTAFTNLTQDHLDYHHTMENYFQAKAKLFEQMAQDTRSRRKPVAVINIDDAYGRRLAEMFSGRMTVKTYGSALGADFRMLVHHATAKGSEYELEYKGKSYLVRVPLIGKFNMYNSLAALAAVICAGIPVRDAIANLQNIPQVPGRLELFTHPGGAQIFIDYAHTPDALENVCKTLKELCSRRLITVFGCGGDRDRGKRPLMGAAAARLSDACIVTSDNPRSEEPLSIISQIAAGMPEGRYAIIPDRARAIATAIEQARLGDIVLIAGKGHENYQELSTGRIDFSDAKEVRRNMFIKEREEFPQA